MKEYRAGILPVSVRLLEEALNFPDGHHIEGIQFDLEQRYRGMVKLLITGSEMPIVPEASAIPEVHGMISHDARKMHFTWQGKEEEQDG